MKIKEHLIANTLQFGGSSKIVQIDETIINYKVKSHRG